jgi:ribosome-associated protein
VKLQINGGNHIAKRGPAKINYDTVLKIITKALEDKKALEISVIDVTKQPILTDFIVLASSGASTHLRALARGVDEALEKKGYVVPCWQGKHESNWLVLDLGSIVVHIMGEEERKKYSIEDIWGTTAVTYHM